MIDKLQQWTLLALTVIAFAFFVLVPSLQSAIVATTFAIVQGLSVLVQAYTNKALADRLESAVALLEDGDQLQRDRINRFITAFQPVVANMNMNTRS